MKRQSKSGSFRTKGETILSKAIRTVPGFGETYRKFEQQSVPASKQRAVGDGSQG